MAVTRGCLERAGGLYAGSGNHGSFASSSQLVKHCDGYAEMIVYTNQLSVVAQSILTLIEAKEVRFAKRGGGGGKWRSHCITLTLGRYTSD